MGVGAEEEVYVYCVGFIQKQTLEKFHLFPEEKGHLVPAKVNVFFFAFLKTWLKTCSTLAGVGYNLNVQNYLFTNQSHYYQYFIINITNQFLEYTSIPPITSIFLQLQKDTFRSGNKIMRFCSGKGESILLENLLF